MTTVFVSGIPGTPVGAFVDVQRSGTANVSSLLTCALLSTGQSDATVRSVRFAASVAAAADFCDSAPDAFVRVLSRWIDTRSIGALLLVHLNRDVATGMDVPTAMVKETRDAACTATSTPRRVQLVCKVHTPPQPQRARASQTQAAVLRDVGCTTEPMGLVQLRAELRNQMQTEIAPLLERSILAAEHALKRVEEMRLECKRANFAAFERVRASAAAASADRKAAAEDRAAAAASRAAVEHALAQNEGLMDLLRARVRSAEGRSSERVSDC